MNKITTIFFDLDNTLFDQTSAEKEGIGAVRNKYFPTVEINNFVAIWNEISKKNWELYTQGDLSFEEQRTQRIIDVWKTFGKKIKPQEAKEFFKQYMSFYRKAWKSFPNVKSVLKKISDRKIRLGIITNGNPLQQLDKLKMIGIHELFEEELIIISEAVGYVKPQQEIFLLAQKLAGTISNEILMVGDNLILDIETPRKLSWSSVHIDHYKKTNNPDSLKNIKDILKILD